jgi:hypothetical protein
MKNAGMKGNIGERNSHSGSERGGCCFRLRRVPDSSDFRLLEFSRISKRSGTLARKSQNRAREKNVLEQSEV